MIPEFLKMLINMCVCMECEETLSGDCDFVIISDEQDIVGMWHMACAPIPPIIKTQAECRAMSGLN